MATIEFLQKVKTTRERDDGRTESVSSFKSLSSSYNSAINALELLDRMSVQGSIIRFLCFTMPGITLVGAFVSCASSLNAFYPTDHSRQTSLCSSRRQDYYSEYDDYYPPPVTGFREIEESLEQQYRAARDPGFRFYENESPRAALARIDDWDEEEDYDQNSDEDDLDTTSGNFWLNPEGNLDPVDDLPRRRRRSPRPNPVKRNRPTTFRSGFPSVPPPVNELYNRLFWYGIDPNGDTSPADRTMFGGTKGKFNGLSYLKESDGLSRPPRRRRSTRRPRSASDLDDRAGEYYDERGEPGPYYDEDYDSPDEYDYTPQNGQEEMRSTSSSKRRPVTPPYDPPVPRREVRRNSARQRNRSPARESWESSTVAKWFSGEEDEEEYLNNERGSTRRKRQKGKDGWSAFDIVDAFLGLNRDELQKQAKDYEQRMGIKREAPTRRRRRERPMPDVAERALRNEPADFDEPKVPIYDDVIDTTANSVEPSGKVEELGDELPMIELSWEERALAIERVPPAGIPAWGPNGELGFDARTKAVMDALEDIAGAKEIVENRKKRVADCREEMTILRIDSELERKRLKDSRLSTQAIGEKLRRMDLKMESSARKLRRSQIGLKNAKQDLAELEARHWAVLGFYDPERAGVSVEDALLELKEQEPAVRHIFEKEDHALAEEVEPSSNRDTEDSNSNY